MTLEDIYYISQIVAVVAILGSLVAIWFQMRQNHEIERGNAQRDLLDQTRDWWLLGVQDEVWFDTISAGLQDFRSLDRLQKARFSAWGYNLLHIVEGVFFQNRSRLIISTSHEGYVVATLSILNTPGGRTWWDDEGSKIVNAEFSAYLSKRLATQASPPPLWTDLMPHFKSRSLKPGEAA